MNVQRVLFPTDFSHLSKAAEHSACDLADQFGAELHALHVLDDLFLTMSQTAAALLISPDSLDDVITTAEADIQKIPPCAWASGKRVVRAVRIGTSRFSEVIGVSSHNAGLCFRARLVVHAEYKNGVLRLTMPKKTEPIHSEKIEVKAVK